MASQDVIELGSSDDEPEPAPKKIKPLPNAMVHIPNKLHNASSKQSIVSVQKKLAGKPVTIKLVEKQTKPKSMRVNPLATKTNVRSAPVKSGKCQALKKPITIVNSHNFTASTSKMKLHAPIGIINAPSWAPPSSQLPKSVQALRLKTQKNLFNLPPSVTIIKKKPLVIHKDVGRKQIAIKQPFGLNRVPIKSQTVEFDQVDPLQGAPGPQWYVRPEDQNKTETMEKQNNSEPDSIHTVEITIEDSPVKPNSNKRMHEVGAELAITIDDSPVKFKAGKDEGDNGSSSDNEPEASSKKIPQSKRQLNYPKANDVVEIELEPMEVDCEDIGSNIPHQKDNNANKKNYELSFTLEPKHASTPKRNPKPALKPVLNAKPSNNDDLMIITEESNEFIPIYQNFIGLCFKLENSEDMKKIVEKKIKAYYRQTPREYVESEEFIDMVTSKVLAMQADPEKMYLYIKDIVDELNVQRKMSKAQPVKEDFNDKSVTEKPWYEEGGDFDFKRQRQIRKLEKTLKKLHRAIQKLEEQEVDFDDDEDSVYLLTERYKERMVRVHAKFCQLTNTKMPSEPRIHIEARPGRPTGPAKKLEKWINKKVPIGTPLPFPDFHDVLKCVRDSNIEDKLDWNEADIMDEARDIFTRCGKKLQRRRQENEWRLAASRISTDVDPSENSEELKKKLEDNRKAASRKESEVLNKFADRQNLLKLEAVEINEKEADESPVESEEEESNDEGSSLNNKEKRKERLKRLLYEKTKRNTTEGIENQQSNTNDSKTTQQDDNNLLPNSGEPTEKTSKPHVNSESESKNNDMELEASTQNTIPAEVKENQDQKIVNENLSINDDSDKLDSDVDELNLLQKLHSENEKNSTLESSSDTPISICDTSDSNDEKNDGAPPDDVISIENSSYSESETKENEVDKFEYNNDLDQNEKDDATQKEAAEETQDSKYKKINGFIESILLASSDEEVVDGVENLDTVSCISMSVDNVDKEEDADVNETEKEIDDTTTVTSIVSDKSKENLTDIHSTEITTPEETVAVLATIIDDSTLNTSQNKENNNGHVETVPDSNVNNNENVEHLSEIQAANVLPDET